ncbi:MAG: carbon-nitrogen hydrolase family protein [Bacteroidetes bacterium]|nr:carbon-nitrogen hydrolase family protein [Bacteroidota bacterium]
MSRFIFVLILFLSSVFYETEAQNTTYSQSGKMVVAACQFPVLAKIEENYNWIKNQIIEAKLKKSDIVQFAECALSGYPGSDLKTLENFDWNMLYEKTDSILSLAKQLKIWVVLGSIHRLSEGIKPHNSLYVINSEGEIVDRYDKRFCTSGDLNHFSPGNHFVNFQLNGVKCGLLICYDVRFPELYREYKKLDTDLIFHSFYNAHQKKGSIHPVIMPITSQARAATNYFYISLTNSSAQESWPCHFITPNGLIQNKLPENEPGILLSKVDLSEKFYDASSKYRNNALNGILNSGETVLNRHSINRTEIIKQ